MVSALLKPWIATCPETHGLLSEYVDGELDGRGLSRVKRHLARCDRCRAMLESLSRTLQQLHSLAPPSSAAATTAATVTGVLSRIRRDGQ
ncbi:MAG TPA: zf-HC2 domain-containing protein [Gaiellaceae bacterium]|nr:zf-HC2 domain-containing protein [Gaiellaceae bacterium]